MAWKIAKRFRVAERAGAKRGAPRRALPALKSSFRRLPKPTAKAVRRIAKAVMERRAETKIVVLESTQASQSLLSGTTSLVGNYLIVSPSSVSASYAYNLTRGSGNDEIIGNKVSTKYLKLSMVVTPYPYNATSNPVTQPMLLRMYLFRAKTTPMTDIVASDFVGGTANFFEDGATYTGFGGTLMDMNRKITSDNYVYLAHRDFKLGPALTVAGTGNGTVNSYGANNDFKLNYHFNWNITKSIQKQFNLNDDNQVMTPYTFLLWQVVPAYAGATYTANVSTPVTVQARVEFGYQDD